MGLTGARARTEGFGGASVLGERNTSSMKGRPASRPLKVMFVQTDEERASTIQPESHDFAETGGTTQLSQPNLLLVRGRPVFDLEYLNEDRHLGAIDLAAIFQAVASNGLESLPPERKLLPRMRVAIDDGDDF